MSDVTKDCKNFSKIADLSVERVKLKNVESLKSCETDIAKRRWFIHILRWVVRTVFERRRSTSKTMLVNEIESTKKLKRSVGIM